jgi:peroxiredoxin
VVGVAWTGSESDFEDFVSRHGLTFPSLNDEAGAVYERFQIPYQPAFAVVRPDGQVETLLGSAGDDVIDMIIRDAVS